MIKQKKGILILCYLYLTVASIACESVSKYSRTINCTTNNIESVNTQKLECIDTFYTKIINILKSGKSNVNVSYSNEKLYKLIERHKIIESNEAFLDKKYSQLLQKLNIYSNKTYLKKYDEKKRYIDKLDKKWKKTHSSCLLNTSDMDTCNRSKKIANNLKNEIIKSKEMENVYLLRYLLQLRKKSYAIKDKLTTYKKEKDNIYKNIETLKKQKYDDMMFTIQEKGVKCLSNRYKKCTSLFQELLETHIFGDNPFIIMGSINSCVIDNYSQQLSIKEFKKWKLQ